MLKVTFIAEMVNRSEVHRHFFTLFFFKVRAIFTYLLLQKLTGNEESGERLLRCLRPRARAAALGQPRSKSGRSRERGEPVARPA